MQSFDSLMFRLIIISLLMNGTLFSQIADSTHQKSPSKAVRAALLLPGGGQFYNGQKLKGGLLISGALVFGFLYADHAKKYSDYSGGDTDEKARYLKLRNKYGWWVGFVYIYGLLDAIVEAHLHPFNKVMNEDLEKSKVEVSKEQ